MSAILPFLDGSQLCAQVDPEVFFPQVGGTSHEAKAVCAQCPLKAPCRAYALDAEPVLGFPLDGVWGGLSAPDRKRIRARRRRADRDRTRWGDPPPAPVVPVPGQLPLPSLLRSA